MGTRQASYCHALTVSRATFFAFVYIGWHSNLEILLKMVEPNADIVNTLRHGHKYIIKHMIKFVLHADGFWIPSAGEN